MDFVEGDENNIVTKSKHSTKRSIVVEPTQDAKKNDAEETDDMAPADSLGKETKKETPVLKELSSHDPSGSKHTVGDFLPFQNLSVELEEDDEEQSNDTLGESTDAVVENMDVSSKNTDDDNASENLDVVGGSEKVNKNIHTISERVNTVGESISDDIDGVSETMESNTSCENTMLSASPISFELSDKKVSDDTDKFITDDSTIDQSEIFTRKEDSDNSQFLPMPTTEIKQEPATSYLEDFLFTSGSNFIPDSDSTSSDEKGLQLRKFPSIVRGVEKADYEVLQALYLVLYLRNAWDTEPILVQRILDFSGFNCEPSSEDFYTRKLNLCTMSNELLFKIKNLLGIQSRWFLSMQSEEAKLDTVQKILNFLHKPSKKPRRPRNSDGRTRGRRGSTRGRQRSKAKPQSIEDAISSVVDDSSNSVAEDTSCKVGLNYVRPGPLTFKLKAAGLSESAILELEKEFKERLAKGKVSEPKVMLEPMDALFTLKEANAKKNANTTSEKKTTDPVSEKTKPLLVRWGKTLGKKPTKSTADASDSVTENKDNASPDPSSDIVVKVETQPQDTEMEETKEDEDEEKAVVEEKKAEEISEKDETSNETLEPIPKKKLKDFPLVFSSIEGTPDKLLVEIYFLLFLEKENLETEEIKDRILEFDGFIFGEDSTDFKTRKAVLDMMTESMVKDVARALYLDPKTDKISTEEHLLTFLKSPTASLLRPTFIAPGMLADVDLDIDAMSDSDDSIICEIVPKKVVTVDLLSSDEEDHAPVASTNKEVPKNKVAPVVAPQTTPSVPRVVVPPSAPVASAPSTPANSSNTPRSLRDFVTIKKIVETHPNEYLVDIFNLLYMENCQPENLRKDILDFGGFEFDRTSPQYTKRKLFLDRMLYNSVRRIYNTLIHNTREVKVFSKPTMIGEIFDFLLKLPDHDTSVPPPRTTPAVKTYSNFSNVSNIITSEGFQNKEQSGKLSDLKRVFQRVACFPCEYLVDVHKLLFMTDCEMKDIRANIFGFRGFTFSVGSQEFNQRKMFLEYLTFHSLRKISSVLTTKTVDMRNSTKHELASHLTEVLKEYTNMQLDGDTIEPPNLELKAVPPTPEKNTTISATSAVEQLVVTPIILPMQSTTSSSASQKTSEDTVSSSTSVDNSKASRTSSAKAQASDSNRAKVLFKEKVSSASVSSTKDSSSSDGTAKKTMSKTSPKTAESTPVRTDSPSSSTPTKEVTNRQRANEANEKKRKLTPLLAKTPQNMQFADINLPDIEKYRQIYKSNLNICGPKSGSSASSAVNVSSSTTYGGYQPEFLIQQVSQPLPLITSSMAQSSGQFTQSVGQPSSMTTVGQPLAPLMTPTVQLPMMHPFQQQIPIPNSTFFMQSPSYLNPANNSDIVTIPVECILQEGNTMNMPGPKRFKQMVQQFPGDPSSEDSSKAVNTPQSDKDENPSSSLQYKIRDAMTKTLEDEEDCDKPLATLVGHPNDRVLKQQICEIVENTDLQDISINGVIQKIYNMYPKFDLNYRKEFIKTTLRSLLYRLGEQEEKMDIPIDATELSSKGDCSVTTTNKQTKQHQKTSS